MATAKRFMITPMTVGLHETAESEPRLAASIAHGAAPSPVRQSDSGHRVVEMTEAEAAEWQAKNPSVVIEEDLPLRRGIPGLLEPHRAEMLYHYPVRVVEAGTRRPIPDVSVFGLGGSFNHRAETNTDENGETVLGATVSALSIALATPRDTYWSKLAFNIPASSVSPDKPLEIELTPLTLHHGYDWGHRLMGFPQVNKVWTGCGVRVGVVDSGIASNVHKIEPCGGFNTLDGEDACAWDRDLKGHGTHCAGIVAARDDSKGLTGGAPAADVFALRVFPGGYSSDIKEAVHWCIENEMDVISMSLEMPQHSGGLAMALNHAYAKGITVVAAAGNDSGPVGYPAVCPTVIGVGALGAANTFPPDSQHAMKMGARAPYLPGVFAGSFSNFGPGVDVCAPGVAIQSTVPTGFAAWDGTSMACPMVAGLVALILEAYPDVRTGDSRQCEYVRALLNASACDLGLPAVIQGRGLPYAPKILPTSKA